MQPRNRNPEDDEVDIRRLLSIVWAGKWLVGAIAFAVSLIAVIVSLGLPNIYRAEALLAPKMQEGTGGLSSLAAQYGSIASVAGINLASGQSDKTLLGLEVLKSRQFFSDFVARHGILVPLMAAESWDRESGHLEIDPKKYNVSSKEWVRDVSPPKRRVPSMQEAHKRFLEILRVNQDPKTGFVSISIEHYSPLVAKQWVDWLINDLNTTIMQQDVSEAEQAIKYLNEQVQKTSLAELQSIFFGLIEQQTKTVMLSKVSGDYLFKVLDPAIVPEQKSGPRRSLIVLTVALLGGFFGVTIVLANAAFRTRQSS